MAPTTAPYSFKLDADIELVLKNVKCEGKSFLIQDVTDVKYSSRHPVPIVDAFVANLD